MVVVSAVGWVAGSVVLVAESAVAWVADSAVALAVELDCMSRQAQVVSVLVAGLVVASAADSVHTSRPLLAVLQLVVEWAADSVAAWAAVWVVDSAVALAVELGCMSCQIQVVSVLVAETAAGLVAA